MSRLRLAIATHQSFVVATHSHYGRRALTWPAICAVGRNCRKSSIASGCRRRWTATARSHRVLMFFWLPHQGVDLPVVLFLLDEQEGAGFRAGGKHQLAARSGGRCRRDLPHLAGIGVELANRDEPLR